MGRSVEWAQEQQEYQENLSGLNSEAYFAQQALPEHKRDGYAERVRCAADDARKVERKANPF